MSKKPYKSEEAKEKEILMKDFNIPQNINRRNIMRTATIGAFALVYSCGGHGGSHGSLMNEFVCAVLQQKTINRHFNGIKLDHFRDSCPHLSTKKRRIIKNSTV